MVRRQNRHVDARGVVPVVIDAALPETGLTLIEVIVALVVAAVLGAAATATLLAVRRGVSIQLHQSSVSATARTAGLVLSREFRAIGVGDSSGADLSMLTPAAVRYRAWRGMYIVCAPSNPGSGSLTVAAPGRAWRGPDALVDSLLVLVSAPDSGGHEEHYWWPADLVSVSGGGTCPGGVAGLRLVLAGVSSGRLVGVRVGNPVRVFETVEVRAYRGGSGRWWLGRRRARKTGGWPAIQPFVGPLAVGGLVLTYQNGTGGVAVGPADVVTIGVELTMPPAPGGLGRGGRRVVFRVARRD